MGQEKTICSEVEEVEQDVEELYDEGGYSPDDIETSTWWKDKAIKFNFAKIDLTKNDKGELKKKCVGLPPQWQTITKSKKEKEGMCRGVLLNKDVGLMAIDFDDKEDYKRYYDKFDWIRNQPTEETKNGFHLYCQFDDRLTAKNYKNLNGEILNNGFAICSPTTYRYKDNEYKYEWINESKTNKLNSIPQEIIDFIKKDGEGFWRKKGEPTKKLKILQTKETLDDYADPNLPSKKGEINEELYKVIKLIIYKNAEEEYHYNDWFNILCALYNCGNQIDKLEQFKELAHKFSSASQKYNKKTTDFKFMEGSKFCKTEGTIRHYAREANEKAYSKIIRDTIRLEGKAIFEEIDLRDYFLGIRGGDVLTFRVNPKEFFIWKEDESKWRKDNGDQLKDEIVEVINKLHNDNLNEFSNQLKKATATYTALSKQEPLDETAVGKAEGELNKAKALHKQMYKTKATFGKNKANNIFGLVAYKLATRAEETNLFDNRPEIFAFKNKCYNLETRQWFKAQKTDYILANCDRDYIEPTPEADEYIETLFKQIFVDEEKRKCCLSILHTGLSGYRQEKFIVYNGEGRNGKGVINEFMKYLMGNKYFYRPPISSITKQKEGDSNQGLRGMHKMRYMVYSEPEEKSSKGDNATNLKTNLIKEITGNESINARGIYEKDTETKMNGTIVIECNKKPSLKGEKDHAIKERIVILEFESSFQDMNDPAGKAKVDKDLIAFEETGKKIYNFAGDPKIKNEDNLKKYYCAFFKHIITKNKNLQLYLPPCTRMAAMEWLQSEDEFSEWFQEFYEPTELNTTKGAINDFIPAKEVFKKWSYHLQGANKKEKRAKNEKSFKNDLKKNILTQDFYREIKQAGKVRLWEKSVKKMQEKGSDGFTKWISKYIYTESEQKQNATCGIIGWRLIQKEEDDEASGDDEMFNDSDSEY